MREIHIIVHSAEEGIRNEDIQNIINELYLQTIEKILAKTELSKEIKNGLLKELVEKIEL